MSPPSRQQFVAGSVRNARVDGRLSRERFGVRPRRGIDARERHGDGDGQRVGRRNRDRHETVAEGDTTTIDTDEDEAPRAVYVICRERELVYDERLDG